MSNLLLRCVFKTPDGLLINVSKLVKRFQFNFRKAREISTNTFCRGKLCSTGRSVFNVNYVKLLSTTNLNCVKFFAEKENDYAHFVMESNASYSQTLYKRRLLEHNSLCDGDYIKYIRSDWSNSSPSELLSAFTDITHYCAARSKPITDPELTNLSKAVAEKCVDFSDEELLKCLECLTHWPETESLKSVNFVDVWSALDKACLSRIKVWNAKTLLYVADIWYSLHLSRISKYVGECIWRLGRKVRHLSPQELVQCMFYMNSSRKFKVPSSMYEFEFYIEQSIEKLSVDELSIIAMGFFKSKTQIRSSRLLSCMMQKTGEKINTVNEVSLCSLMKLFRYRLPLLLINDVKELLDKTVPNISRLSLLCCVQIALVGSPVQLFHRQIITAVVQRFLDELPTSRLKDIERMIFVLTLFNYVPECAPDFFEQVTAEIQNSTRESEIHQYPRNLAYCLNYLSFKGIYLTDLLHKVMSQQFIEETYDGKNLYSLGRELLCLDVAIEIDCPSYKGNRLDPRYRRFLAKRYTKWVPDRSKKNLSVTERLFVDVLDAVEGAVGRECVYADVISPNYAIPDVVLAVDADGKGIPVADLFSNYRIEDVKYAPRLAQSGRWFCVVVAGMNMFIRNENTLLGTTITKLRHLGRIGYRPIVVPWFEFSDLSAAEKPEYLRRKIFSTNCTQSEAT
ncbi:FAST kinase domain-containing protein 5, mitochondrial [Bacillus rossius redtenbacheri]|uniref:FAST kinase domain-containing protein 5, mitochondrial n=1 Tax=Bacillus rossius redtenbacheri TaxID=93214 RepID=UPI002FDDE440